MDVFGSSVQDTDASSADLSWVYCKKLGQDGTLYAIFQTGLVFSTGVLSLDGKKSIQLITSTLMLFYHTVSVKL